LRHWLFLSSVTDGTIDATYKYAWGENIGWIDFSTTTGNVHVTDSGLSGYALSETVGWIYLGDISNDGAGNLSGTAWSENAGWIKFNPTNGGVIINSSGELPARLFQKMSAGLFLTAIIQLRLTGDQEVLDRLAITQLMMTETA